MSLKLTWAAAVVGAFIAVGCGKKEEAPAPAPAPAPAAEAPAAASAPAPAPAAAAGGETHRAGSRMESFLPGLAAPPFSGGTGTSTGWSKDLPVVWSKPKLQKRGYF